MTTKFENFNTFEILVLVIKKIVLLSLFVPFLGCNRDNDKDKELIKYFDPVSINQLNLANIDNFWSEGIKIDTSYYMGAHFENYPGFIKGINFYSGNGKRIWISVFKTKEDAVIAMEFRINDVACVINNGNSDEFENKWWYSECMEYMIFVNQHNTIVELDFSSNAPFELIKDKLLDIAKEINKRIDSLSITVSG